MNDRIRELLEQMKNLEDELLTALQEQETRMFFQVRGKRIEFEQAVRDAHLGLRTGLRRWFATSQPRNALSAPFIYAMVLPFLVLDLSVSLYQAVCFPLYRIRKVPRDAYIVIDRQHLAYLNVMERLHCMYCGYANGLIAYVREVAARTEQYWCPVKHARKVLGTHSRYVNFLDYGDAAAFHEGVASLRRELAKERAAGS